MNTPEFRHYSVFDTIIREADHVLNNIFCEQPSSRDYPADQCEDSYTLSAQEKKQAAGLMRVNHAGEVSAQALYQHRMLEAGQIREEIDKLPW